MLDIISHVVVANRIPDTKTIANPSFNNISILLLSEVAGGALLFSNLKLLISSTAINKNIAAGIFKMKDSTIIMISDTLFCLSSSIDKKLLASRTIPSINNTDPRTGTNGTTNKALTKYNILDILICLFASGMVTSLFFILFKYNTFMFSCLLVFDKKEQGFYLFFIF
jgi:hypothetical protein